jgi:Icc-related predicted phosphoesterase
MIATMRKEILLVLSIIVLVPVLGCGPAEPPSTSMALDLDIPTRVPGADRVVAIGDLHGDLAATRAALRLAGAIDENDQWVGGDLVVVQTGDILDRGGDEIEILSLLEDLATQARAVGGDVHALNGNHELMNVKLDLRYVTLEGYLDFLPTPMTEADTVEPQMVVDGVVERIKAFRPGGPIARRLAERNVIAIVGDTVFVHGGVLPHVVEYGIERLNQETRSWIRREIECPPDVLLARDGPVWSRHYSDEPDEEDCRILEETLEMLGAERMVVGHTVQDKGMTSACQGKVWRIDVGMAAHYGGSPAVLELSGGNVQVLTPTSFSTDSTN